MPETVERDDQADENATAVELPPDERAVSWGPTWGPETGDDVARASRKRRSSWHPPGGPW